MWLVVIIIGDDTAQTRSRSRVRHCLAFTRYCHDQYCMVYGLLKGGRGSGGRSCSVSSSVAVQWYGNSMGNAGRRGNERMIDSC